MRKEGDENENKSSWISLGIKIIEITEKSKKIAHWKNLSRFLFLVCWKILKDTSNYCSKKHALYNLFFLYHDNMKIPSLCNWI
jgi:hypothetical protein